MIEWVKNDGKECNGWKRIEKIFGGHELIKKKLGYRIYKDWKIDRNYLYYYY